MDNDDRTTLARAREAARSLKSGTWESVEALSVLAIASHDPAVLESARGAAVRLKAGTWESVRALAWLAKAEKDLDAIP